MIDKNVKRIMEKILHSGYEVYIVGGAVRDTVMGRVIKDWDLTTNAKPEIIESLFEKTINIGKAFGTIVVVIDDQHYEITTFRVDSTLTDGRKPETVEYSQSIKDDILRRDFTLNAMYMDIEGQIYDDLQGSDSIKKKVLFTVGDAKQRFLEDYLRVYRYVRFTSELSFNSNPEINETIKHMTINKTISFERIRDEFNKIILTDKPSIGIRLLRHLNLLAYICPSIEAMYDFNQHSQYHHKDVFDHTMLVIDATPKVLTYRLAALFHDIGKPNTFELVEGEGHFYGHDKESVVLTEKIMKRLKYPNKEIAEVLLLVKNHMRLLDVENDKSLKKFIRKIGVDHIDGYITLRKADISGSKTQGTIEEIERLHEKLKAIVEFEPPLQITDLDIDGHDLMSLGLSGPEIGKILSELLIIVDEDQSLNYKEKLIQIVGKLIKS